MKNKFMVLIAAFFILSLSGCANYDINFNKVNDMTTQR
jgi:outer membrane lipoprotein SlyB